MWPRPGEGLDRVLAAEAAVEGLYREALTRWSPVAMAAALPTFGAAVTADASPDSTASTDPQLPPDPAAVEQSSGWTTVAETVIVAGIAVLFAAAVVEAMEGLGIPLPSIGLPGLPGKRQESAGNPQVAPPTSRATVTRDQAKQSHQTIPDQPPTARPDPIPAPLAPNPQDTAAKPQVAPNLDPAVLAIVNDAATDMDAAQLHEAMRIVDETPALAQARDAVIETQRDAAARTPHVVAQKVTAAIRDVEPTDGAVTLAAQRSAAADVLDPGGDAMAKIAATAGHLSAAVQNQAVQAAAQLSEDADVLEKTWIATIDSRCRPTHFAADGARVPLAAPFIVGGEPLMYPADPTGSPAETYNCVPADTRVSGRATAAMLRRFRGRMFEVSTALGHKLSATANHSVLTRRGWRPVASLQPGDEIAGTLDAWTAAGAVDPHVANGEPTIEECARAIEFTGAGHEWVESGFVDLDSDVADGQVKVHRADLTLTFGRHTEQLKKLGEFLVQGSEGEVRLADHESSLLRVRHSDECLLASVPDGNAHTAEPASHVIAAAANGVGDGLDRVSSYPGFSDRGIGSTEVSHVPFVTSAELDARVLEASAHDVASHSEPLCDDVGGEKFGLVEANHLSHVSFPTLGGGSSYRHTDVLEAARDHFPTDAEMATDSANGVTGLVLSDDFVPDLVSLSAGHFCWVTVTQLTHRHFDGHVFDLTTEEGFYLTSGLISHNCRCRMGILAKDEPLPTEVDRHTERLDGRDSVAVHREGRTQVEEIEARAARGNTRARDNRDGQGTVASGGWTAPSDQEYDMTAPAVPADDTATEAAAAEAETFLTFTDALFAVTGTPTDDRRMLASAIELGFRDFPLPLQWKEKTGDGHKGSVTVGVIESATLNEQGEVRGSGYMLNNENAYKALELIQHGVNRPSIDMADATAVLAFDDGTEVTEENFDPAQRICETYTRATVTACTIVAIPAFGQTRLALNPERESRDVAMTAAALTAAAAYQHPVYEPAMFADADPNLLSPMRLTIDPDTGHVFGFIATWKDKHRSVGLGHIKPPRSHTNYEHFHTSPAVHLSDGTRLPVGRLTVGIGHAPTRGISSAAAQAHYDNVEACWALGRITEHRLGIYFSGVVAPWASPEKVQMGLASPVSGDWRPVGQGNALELVAVLSVNTPGFLCKVETDATGAPSAMVASLSVADDAPAAGSWSLDELKAVFAQVLAEDRAATLQNADKSQMVNEGLLMATPEDTQATAVDKAPAPEVDATARMGELIAQFSGTPIEPPAAPEPEVVPVELTPTERMGELIAEFEGVYVELGIRKVKNAEYWGRPAGTPITPGMKPEGKRARSQRKFDTRKKQLREIGTLFRSPKEEAEYRYMETRSGPRRASGKAAEKAAFRKQLEQSPAAEKKKPESAESINADAKLKAAQREADARHATTKARLDAESKLLADHAAKKKPDTASSALDTPEKVDAEYEKRLDALYDHLDQEYPDPEDQYDYQKAKARALKQLDDWRNEQMDQIKAKKAAPKG